MEYHHCFDCTLRTFEMMDKIVIAASRRCFLGGALRFALTCDIRVAASHAILDMSAIKEGHVPGMGTWRLPHYIGLGRAKRDALSGENIKTREGLAIGLVDYGVLLAQFERRVEKIAQEYVGKCSTGRIQTKLLQPTSFHFDYGLFYEKYKRQELAQTSDEHMEARKAYCERRDPLIK